MATVARISIESEVIRLANGVLIHDDVPDGRQGGYISETKRWKSRSVPQSRRSGVEPEWDGEEKRWTEMGSGEGNIIGASLTGLIRGGVE